MSFIQELRIATRQALVYFKQRGHYLGELPSRDTEGKLTSTTANKFKRQVEDATSTGACACYMMKIELRHQGNPKLFDPLVYPPTTNWWPHDEMLADLQGRAKDIRDWAQANGLKATISLDTSFDSVRRVNARWYSLVVSWSEEKSAEVAA